MHPAPAVPSTPSDLAPLISGSHCAGIGCAHDELADPDAGTFAPERRTIARHRDSSTGRRRGADPAAHRTSVRGAHALDA